MHEYEHDDKCEYESICAMASSSSIWYLVSREEHTIQTPIRHRLT